MAYLLFRRPEHFPRGAAQIYATFDIGLVGYWAVPTAPPWYAARQGLMADGRTPELRRMMVEYGEQFWKSGWALCTVSWEAIHSLPCRRCISPPP